MVVGEPSLMGGEFGEEDERLITRLENTQYDPSIGHAPSSLDDPAAGVPPYGGGGPGGGGGGGPPGGLPPHWADHSVVQALPLSTQEMEIKHSPPN